MSTRTISIILAVFVQCFMFTVLYEKLACCATYKAVQFCCFLGLAPIPQGESDYRGDMVHVCAPCFEQSLFSQSYINCARVSSGGKQRKGEGRARYGQHHRST